MVVLCVCVCWGRGYTHAVVVLSVCVGVGGYTHAVVVLSVCFGGVCSWFWLGSIPNGL